MKKVKALTIILLFTFCTLAAGCGGGGAEVRTTSTTMGQELTDLQQAKEKGLVSEEEFEKAKKRILERN
ncbi:MAG: hypothetical protein BM485_12405 [Desulfobulbaceae bacterium DB1]|nr:MAG: hypothetical protein BM485_12405 [Desulfobulbaceae bacterium DB1]